MTAGVKNLCRGLADTPQLIVVDINATAFSQGDNRKAILCDELLDFLVFVRLVVAVNGPRPK